MLVHINRQPIVGPWGGGAHFINAFHEFADGCREGIELDKDITGRANPDVILLVGLENDMRGGISAEQAIMYQMGIKPACKLVLRVNENDARKASHGVDDMWVKVSKYIDSTVFVSKWLQDYFNERGWACKDQHVIYNGVQRSVFKSGTKLDNGKLNIAAHHWSDNKMKGADVYEKIDQLVGEHPDKFSFTYIGRHQCNFQHTKVIRPLHGKALGDELGKYDVYVSASRFDPGPNHVTEALACGLPTYVHKDGGGAVEFAGLDHAFENWERLRDILVTKACAPNSSAIALNDWKTCVREYIDVLWTTGQKT
jgi:hypothetical protein